LNILVATARLGLAQPAKVYDLLHLDASTLSRNVERIRLMPEGRRLIEQALPAWEQAQRLAGELLGDEAVALMGRAAEKLGALKTRR
jgi:DNA-binding MarR family transcriptional regulator